MLVVGFLSLFHICPDKGGNVVCWILRLLSILKGKLEKIQSAHGGISTKLGV